MEYGKMEHEKNQIGPCLAYYPIDGLIECFVCYLYR
jgi:hypothetical protein